MSPGLPGLVLTLVVPPCICHSHVWVKKAPLPTPPASLGEGGWSDVYSRQELWHRKEQHSPAQG